MIKKNGDAYTQRCEPNIPAIPLPMSCEPSPCVGIVCVTSVNGLTGDVVLKSLIVGDKQYNGSSDIEITASDLGLEFALKYKGQLSKEQIDKLDAETGDLYYCTSDDFYYLSMGEGEWKKLPSDKLIEQDKSDIKKLREDLDLLRFEFDNLPKLAKTGNVNDLLQDEGDFLVLDCCVEI